MSVHRTCCCGCGNNPCNGTEYQYEDTSGSCPVCALGTTSYSDVKYWYGFPPPTEPSIEEMEEIPHVGDVCHRGPFGNFDDSNACTEYDECEPNLLPPQFLDAGGTDMGVFPWSLSSSVNRTENNMLGDGWLNWIEHGSPLKPKGNCTMKCTQENIGCHSIAFVGALSLRVPLQHNITIPEENTWEWTRDWVESGGKVVIYTFGQSGFFTGDDIYYTTTRKLDQSLGCNIGCDDDSDILNEEEIQLSRDEVKEKLKSFATFVSGGEEFFKEGEEEIDEPFNFPVYGGPNGTQYCCQRTKPPFVKQDSNGDLASFSYHTDKGQGLLPVNEGQVLIGSCDSQDCTAIWKQFGDGAVIVIAHSASGIGGAPWGWFAGGPFTDSDDKYYNNHFWKFLCEEFLTGNQADEECDGISLLDNINIDDPSASNYEENACLPTAACCLADGTCENLNLYQCSKKFGKWSGKCYRDGANPIIYEDYCNRDYESQDIQDWCCPSCEELVEPCKEELGPCCLTPPQGIQFNVCTGIKPQWECCKDFREGDYLYYSWNDCEGECTGGECVECEDEIGCGSGPPCAVGTICCEDGTCQENCNSGCGDGPPCENGLICCEGDVGGICQEECITGDVCCMCIETDEDCVCECLGNLTKDECCNRTEGQGRWIEGADCDICNTCPEVTDESDCVPCRFTGHIECDVWPGSEVNFYKTYPQCHCSIESFNADIEINVDQWSCRVYSDGPLECDPVDPFTVAWSREVEIGSNYDGSISCFLKEVADDSPIIYSGACDQDFTHGGLWVDSLHHPENNTTYEAFDVQYIDDGKCPISVFVHAGFRDINNGLFDHVFKVRVTYPDGGGEWSCEFITKKGMTSTAVESTTIGEIVDSINSAGIGLLATLIAPYDSLFSSTQTLSGNPYGINITTQPTTILYKKPFRGKWRVNTVVSNSPATPCILGTLALGAFETSEWIGRETTSDAESICPTEMNWIFVGTGYPASTGTFNIT